MAVSVLAEREEATAPPPTSSRIAFIDGLRGLAIGWVLVHHAWGYQRFYFALSRNPSGFDRFLNLGAQGVSLFLVVSGFCLSYPVLRRRRQSKDEWFRPSVFFARRCLRILPPYYAALALSVLFIVALGQRASQLPDIGGMPSSGNIAAHVLLIHNLTPYSALINGPFWSLGLEWQWYCVFPLVLLAAIWAPWITFALCLLMAFCWEFSLHPLTGLLTSHGLADVLGRGVLPVRLFEFVCGVLAARLIVEGRIPSRILLALCLIPLPFCFLDPTFYDYHRWVEQPIFGVSFAALLLLGYRINLVNRVLSWRPLVMLGVISYSVYLVHLPAVEFVDRLSPLRDTVLVVPLAACTGLLVGFVFHLLVERPCMQPATWARVSPALLRVFGWTDMILVRWFQPERALSGGPYATAEARVTSTAPAETS